MDTMTPVSLPLPDVLIGAIIRLVELLSGKHTGLREVVQSSFPRVHGKLAVEKEGVEPGKGTGFCYVLFHASAMPIYISLACLPSTGPPKPGNGDGSGFGKQRQATQREPAF